MIIDYNDFLRDLIINVFSSYILMFQIYYRRHGDRATGVALAMLNLFLFTIVIVVTLSKVNIATGFALFAVLSIVSMRSVNIKKIEIGYLFGAVALALINGISLSDYTLLALCNLVIVLGAFFLDSSWIIRPTIKVEITLDKVSLAEIRDTSGLRERVSKQLGGTVQHMTLGKFDPAAGTVRVVAHLRL